MESNQTKAMHTELISLRDVLNKQHIPQTQEAVRGQGIRAAQEKRWGSLSEHDKRYIYTITQEDVSFEILHKNGSTQFDKVMNKQNQMFEISVIQYIC